MKLKNQGKRLGGLLFLSFFLAPGVHAKAAEKDATAEWYLNINRAMLHADDGYQKDTYFVDNYNKSTRLGITGEKKLDNCFTVGGKLEIQYTNPNSVYVSQVSKNGAASSGEDTTFNVRQADTWIKGPFGQISLGHGSMGGFTAIGSDLSGTADTIGYAGPWLMGSLIRFHQSGSTVAATGPTIIQAFSPYETMFYRQNRLRYDTPTFAGFTLSGSIYSGNIPALAMYDGTSLAGTGITAQKYGTDVALRYSNCFEGVKLLGAITFNRLSKGNGAVAAGDINNTKVWDASFAVLHVPTGINGSVQYAQKTLANPGAPTTIATVATQPTYGIPTRIATYPTQKPKFGRVQLGLISDLNCYGPTNFVVDYTQTKNNLENEGKGKGYGAGVVQQLKKVNSEVYVGVRRLKYTAPAATAISYDKILQAFAGIRVSLGGKLAS